MILNSSVVSTSVLFCVYLCGLFTSPYVYAIPEGTIAFRSSRNSQPPNNGALTTIYFIESDGSNERKWLENPQASFSPLSWTTDGKWGAFALIAKTAHIMVMDSQTNEQRNVTAHLGDGLKYLAPALSGDGKWLALTGSPLNWPNQLSDVYVMNLEKGTLKNLTKSPQTIDGTPSWSPDSSKIAFQSTRDENFEIYIMDRTGADEVNLTNHPADDLSASWSPDGQKIAFYSKRDGDSEIYVIDIDGKNPVNLTRHPAQDRVPSWSPDGQWIAFQSTRDGNWEIYIMDQTGGNQTRVTNHHGVDSAPTWVVSDFSLSVTPGDKRITTWGQMKSQPQ